MIRRQPIHEVGVLWSSRSGILVGDDGGPRLNVSTPWAKLEGMVPSVVERRRGLCLDGFLFARRHVIGLVQGRRGRRESRHCVDGYNNGDIPCQVMRDLSIYPRHAVIPRRGTRQICVTKAGCLINARVSVRLRINIACRTWPLLIWPPLVRAHPARKSIEHENRSAAVPEGESGWRFRRGFQGLAFQLGRFDYASTGVATMAESVRGSP